MLTKKTVVLAKIESVYGTDPTPTAAANAVEAYDLEVTPNPEMIERNPGNSDISRFPELRGKTFVDVKFSFPLKGSGTAGTAPRIGPVLRSCGLGETIVSSTSVTYAPISSSLESSTIYAYLDGILHSIPGVVGDLELNYEAGQMPMGVFTGKGLYAIPTDVVIVSPTFDTTTPVIVKGATYSFGSYSAIIEKLMLKLGNKIAERPDFNQTEGFKGFAVTERNPEGSMTIEAILRATSNADFWSYFHSRTVKALSLALGATAGNIQTITASYGYCRVPKWGDREGQRTFEIPFQLARSSGNDEISIALT